MNQLQSNQSSPDQNNNFRVSIIIPAYNEDQSIEKVLNQILITMKGSWFQYEIIVVDDGSKDDTSFIVENIQGVKLLRHQINKGYGSALKTGIKHASNDLIFITDADGTYPNERILEMIEFFENQNCDMVVGSRTGETVKIPLIRLPAKWIIGKLANLVAGESIMDLNSGMRVFKRSISLLFFDLLPDGFSFTTTITLGMLANGYSVEYYPINYEERIGISKIRPLRDTLNFVQLILRMALYFAPLKLFLPISFILMIIAFSWGCYSKFFLQQLADLSTLVLVMTAIQIAVVGLLAELINTRLPKNQKK